MRHGCVLAAGLLLLASGAYCGASLENGFYPLYRGEARHKVTTQRGENLRVGARARPDAKNANIWSLDNCNEVFRLSVEMPGHIGSSYHVLVVDGTAYKQSSTASLGERSVRSCFRILGRKEAEQVANYLSIKPRYRRHPGHRLAVKFVPTEGELEVGKSTVVMMTIRNVGTEEVHFRKGGMSRAPRDNQYTFVARHMGKQIDDVGDSIHFGGRSRSVTLKPGDSFADTADLAKWFRFSETGMYEMLGSYYMAFYESREDRRWIAWEDYATASFTLTVRESPKADLEPARSTGATVEGEGNVEGQE